jgi:hypothetical protein
VREYNENCDRTPRNTRSFDQYFPLDQSVRGEVATSNNNEFGITDQPNLHSPEGTKNNETAISMTAVGRHKQRRH